MVQLSRKFKAPAVRDKAQWAKVQFLVEHGFLFYSVYERHDWGEIRVPYPKTMAEARAFVKGTKRQTGPVKVIGAGQASSSDASSSGE